MRILIAACVLAVLAAPASGQADPPRLSYPGAPDGQIGPLVGEWAAFRPGREDATLMICAAPVTLSDLGGGRLQYQLYYGTPIEFAVTAAGGRTELRHDGPESQAAVWVNEDEFNAHALTAGGEPDWSETLVYHRCPAMPRTSHAGASDGDAAPFAGAWAMYYPPSTGNRPEEVLNSCGRATSIAAIGPDRIRLDNADGDSVEIALGLHDGHTDWRIPEVRTPWEVVWIDADTFHAHTLGIDGRTEWRLPYIYRRC